MSTTETSNSSTNSINDGKVKEIFVDSRINKILSLRTDSAAMLEALDAISEFYVVNSVEARRSLRQDLELQNINLGKKFLGEFDKVILKINSVESMSTQLEKSCDNIAGKVSDADQNMKAFMEKASELENKRNFYLEQSKEIGQFLNRFQLAPEEVDILYRAPIESISGVNSFFDALQRLCIAYQDCKSMVEKHCYTAGFELLDILGQHQDMAYRRLFEWVKVKCDGLVESGSAEDIDSILQIAIRYLKKLPIYYAQCQDLVVNSRRTQLVQKFILALTQGGPSGQLYRAIDLHANDAVRYVGDMLAWMHQSIASEEEFLRTIFGNNIGDKENSNSESNTNTNEIVSNNNGSLQGFTIDELLARCIHGLGRPLRVRIMQTLEGRPQLETLYSLLDLLSFYEITLKKIIPIENAVHSTVNGCLLECKRLFQGNINKQAEALVHSPSSCPLDLTASHATKECTKQIRDILKVFVSSMSALPSDSTDPCHVTSILGSIIQPLLQSCRLSCQASTQADMSVFMLNNVAAIQHELKDIAASQNNLKTQIFVEWINILQSETQTWTDVLVSEEASRMLRRSDMDKLLELVQILPEGLIASEQSGLGQDRVGTVMRAFYASLFSTVAPQFDRLTDPELRERTRKHIAEAIADAHAKVYDLISVPIHGYDVSILLHSADEVKVILGCS